MQKKIYNLSWDMIQDGETKTETHRVESPTDAERFITLIHGPGIYVFDKNTCQAPGRIYQLQSGMQNNPSNFPLQGKYQWDSFQAMVSDIEIPRIPQVVYSPDGRKTLDIALDADKSGVIIRTIERQAVSRKKQFGADADPSKIRPEWFSAQYRKAKFRFVKAFLDNLNWATNASPVALFSVYAVGQKEGPDAHWIPEIIGVPLQKLLEPGIPESLAKAANLFQKQAKPEELSEKVWGKIASDGSVIEIAGKYTRIDMTNGIVRQKDITKKTPYNLEWLDRNISLALYDGTCTLIWDDGYSENIHPEEESIDLYVPDEYDAPAVILRDYPDGTTKMIYPAVGQKITEAQKKAIKEHKSSQAKTKDPQNAITEDSFANLFIEAAKIAAEAINSGQKDNLQKANAMWQQAMRTAENS